MKGTIIEYKPRKSERSKFSAALFGRIVSNKYLGRETFYYSKGALHGIKHKKLLSNKCFLVVEDKQMLNRVEEVLQKFCEEYSIEEGERDFMEDSLLTGVKYWYNNCNEKGIYVRNWARKV